MAGSSFATTRVELCHVAFSHPSSSFAVFEGLSLTFGPGLTGIVGANGAGKTTLVRLVAGDLAPSSGQVRFEPKDALVVVVPQDVESMGDSARVAEDDAGPLRARLGLDVEALERWPTLSPGERRRFQVAGALARDPEVLVLDEPSNHLDADGRAWLVAALSRFRGVGLLVSHDRALLSALTKRTVRVHDGSVRVYDGSYDAARATWQREREASLEARDRAVAHTRKLETQLVSARARREAADRERSTGARMRSRHDSDARTVTATQAAAWADVRAGRDVARTQGALARARAAVTPFEVDATAGARLFARYAPCPSPRLVSLDAPTIAHGDRVILRDVRLTVARDDRVRVEGANGAGKSTLLAALAAAFRGDAARVIRLPQELTRLEAAAVVASVRALPAEARGSVLSLVASLGVDPDRLLASRCPSHGEARKLLLARGLGTHAWGLILDEPTNHFDLPSVERLEAALSSFPGAVVVVSHDPDFARATTRTTWHVDGGHVSVR